MKGKLTWSKPNGDWGVADVDLTTLPPAAYAAVAKLHALEYPTAPTKADALRAMTDEELAGIMAACESCSVCEAVCGNNCQAFGPESREQCKEMILGFLRDPAQ